MIEIGVYNELTILRQTDKGLLLGDEEGNEVLMPTRFCPHEFKIKDTINVFVYLDSQETKIATNARPKITLDEFAFLRVVDINDIGVFLDWGMEKDLMLPFSERSHEMEIGRRYIVYLDIDEQTNRLYASNKINKFLQNNYIPLQAGEEVELLIYKKTDLGYSVIVNGSHQGLIYNNEIFRKIKIGDKLKGFVKTVREDNKLDITLQPIGYDNFNDKNAKMIYDLLLENDGTLPVNDKSAPEEIYNMFGISKKAFKKSIGALYKQRRIIIEDDGIKVAK